MSVSRRQRGGDPPGREHQGRVPGTDHDRDARRVPRDVLRVAVVRGVRAPIEGEVPPAKNRKLRATRGITERTCERSSEPLSRVSTAASSATRASTPSAIRWRTSARSLGVVRGPAFEGVARGGDGRAGFGRSAARDARDDPSRRSGIYPRTGRPVRDALPADPVIGGDRNALDGRALARGYPFPTAGLQPVVRVRTVGSTSRRVKRPGRHGLDRMTCSAAAWLHYPRWAPCLPGRVATGCHPVRR